MQRSRIFLVNQATRDLTPMQEEPYGQEVVIQELDKPTQLPGRFLGDKDEPNSTGLQVRLDLSPEAVDSRGELVVR